MTAQQLTWAKPMGNKIRIIAKSSTSGVKRANAMLTWLRAGGIKATPGRNYWIGEDTTIPELIIEIEVANG